MAQTPPDWKWIGRQVEARRHQLNLTRDEVLGRSGNALSLSTLSSIEKGEAKGRSSMKLAQLAKALDWPLDAFDLLAAGELPAPMVNPADSAGRVEEKLDEILDLLRRASQRPGRPSR